MTKADEVERMAESLFVQQAEKYGYQALTWASPALNRETFRERARKCLEGDE